MSKDIRVSLVLPAYNEAAYLRTCLEAIAQQTVTPFEVIVVDNNSTDETADIAASFPFVKLLRERKQGVVYARTKGFNAARGDVIARIDVDTLLPPDWIESVQYIFADESVAAVSGAAHYYDVALPRIVNTIELFFRRRLAKQLARSDSVFLQGANMAMRRSAWRHIKPVLCMRGNMHEDFDLAIHLQEYGHKVIFEESLVANLSARRTDVSYLKFIDYVKMSPHTYALHHIDARRHMYLVVALSLAGYIPARILYKGYDAETGRFLWSKLLVPAEDRISPVITEE